MGGGRGGFGSRVCDTSIFQGARRKKSAGFVDFVGSDSKLELSRTFKNTTIYSISTGTSQNPGKYIHKKSH